jgi:hypothetical protein
MAPIIPFGKGRRLPFVGTVHWFGNIWKMALFREGIR